MLHNRYQPNEILHSFAWQLRIIGNENNGWAASSCLQHMAHCVVLIRETFAAQNQKTAIHACWPAVLISFLVFRWSLKSSCIINIHDHKDNSNDTLHRLGMLIQSYFISSPSPNGQIALSLLLDTWVFIAQFVWIQPENQLFVCSMWSRFLQMVQFSYCIDISIHSHFSWMSNFEIVQRFVQAKKMKLQKKTWTIFIRE